jgi:hypothetical protein
LVDNYFTNPEMSGLLSYQKRTPIKWLIVSPPPGDISMRPNDEPHFVGFHSINNIKKHYQKALSNRIIENRYKYPNKNHIFQTTFAWVLKQTMT